MTKMQFLQNTSEKLDFRYCYISSKFLEIKLESWTKQKKYDSNCGKLRTKKSRFVSKKNGFFFLQSSRGWVLTVGAAVVLTASVVHANSLISLVCFYILG